ncbi:MAG: recombinase family protein [Pseudomonas sp.]|nr:recombinase family protein [Pseudomonas sp.]
MRVQVVFLNHAIGVTPEESLLLQMQGMIAEYERAKIMERNRRGKLHGARRGSINVLSTAPYGYRYIRKQLDGAPAQYVIDLVQAATVRAIFQWIGMERLSIGEVVRRLTATGTVTASGKPYWDRSTVWGILQNPAYMGRAAFGKTQACDRLPRIRAQRHSAEVPKKGYSTVRTDPSQWVEISVPAIISEGLFHGLIRIPGSTPAKVRLNQTSEKKVCKIVRGVISPLLANIYLHYSLDLWTRQWRERHARGDVIVVRYADDSVVGFRTQWQAQQFLVQLQERLAKFGLSLNASKTRLIEFGRFAARNRRKRGLGKPETFDLLGFTHCCSTNRSGGFQILRLTVKKRMRTTLLAIRDELKRRRHDPILAQGQWLTQVVSGYFNYHTVPGNLKILSGFRKAICRYWRQALGCVFRPIVTARFGTS